MNDTDNMNTMGIPRTRMLETLESYLRDFGTPTGQTLKDGYYLSDGKQ